VSFQTKIYQANDSFCLKTWRVPTAISTLLDLSWVVVEQGVFDLNGHYFMIGSGDITREDSNVGNGNNFIRFNYPTGCEAPELVCAFPSTATVGVIAQLQTLVYDRLLIPRGLLVRSRFTRFVLQPHDAVDLSYYTMMTPETLAYMAFETDIRVSCVEKWTIETRQFTGVTNIKLDISFAEPYAIPPGVFGMIGTSNSLGDSTGLRALDRTTTTTSLITQEDQCVDQETMHTTAEVVFAFVIGEAQGTDGCVICRALFPPPSSWPTLAPSVQSLDLPVSGPSATPSKEPHEASVVPSNIPTANPTISPTVAPTASPSVEPSAAPTVAPTASPSVEPSAAPTVAPTTSPSVKLTAAPTLHDCEDSPPSTRILSEAPSLQPSVSALKLTSAPSFFLSASPSCFPTGAPSTKPTLFPSSSPTLSPTNHPTGDPTGEPTLHDCTDYSSVATTKPSRSPTLLPEASEAEGVPSCLPSSTPTVSLSFMEGTSPPSDGSKAPSNTPSGEVRPTSNSESSSQLPTSDTSPDPWSLLPTSASTEKSARPETLHDESGTSGSSGNGGSDGTKIDASAKDGKPSDANQTRGGTARGDDTAKKTTKKTAISKEKANKNLTNKQDDKNKGSAN
jgi:hypothetical protein